MDSLIETKNGGKYSQCMLSLNVVRLVVDLELWYCKLLTLSRTTQEKVNI